MKRLTKKTLVSIFLTFALISLIATQHTPKTHHETTQTTTLTNQVNTDSIHAALVQEIDSFIQCKYPKSQLKGSSIAEACIQYGFDPCFLLAQGIIESGLGSAGKAVRTGSPWNVGQHDGRSVDEMHRKGLTHHDPNDAIVPYIRLVQNEYLGQDKTYDDLMANYVNLSGHRYASTLKYEQHLRSTYEYLKTSTTIYDLYNQIIES